MSALNLQDRLVPVDPSDSPEVARKSSHYSATGSQVVLDLYECCSDRLDDLEWVKATLTTAARVAGATIVDTVFHRFSPWGISGVVVISESHLAIHIWPELHYAAIDIFTCGSNVKMELATAYLARKFDARRLSQRAFARGEGIAAAESQDGSPRI
jgi:S-adenosylmethionine decarboxylase proenzyme